MYGIDGKEFNHLLETMVQDIEESIHLLEEIKNEVEKEQNKNKQNIQYSNINHLTHGLCLVAVRNLNT